MVEILFIFNLKNFSETEKTKDIMANSNNRLITDIRETASSSLPDKVK
jgi:hypothetical protein